MYSQIKKEVLQSSYSYQSCDHIDYFCYTWQHSELVVRRRPRSWTFDVSILFSETSGLIVDPFIYSNIPEAHVDEVYISQRSKCQERKYGILLIGLAHRYFLPVSIHDLDIHWLQSSSLLCLNHWGLFCYIVDNYCSCSIIHHDNLLRFQFR